METGLLNWTTLFQNLLLFGVMTKAAPLKGNLVYEYNPFRNYRINKPMYEYKNGLYSLLELYLKFGAYIDLDSNNIYITDTDLKIVKDSESKDDVKEYTLLNYPSELKNIAKSLILEAKFYNELDKLNIQSNWVNAEETPYLREKGELCDFITDLLSFSLNNPVHIIPLYSYDGSVNLIINDGLNAPRLINSRFSATGRNTYEVVDRKGNNDTNIYDLGEAFDLDTSLYKRVTKIPKIEFTGIAAGGNLKVGNYHFYFKLSDADGNESDFVGESSLVSVFVGFNSYSSVHTGMSNLNSFKTVNFRLSNLDTSYDYVTVYYSRYTALGNEESNTEYVKIDKKFPVNNAHTCLVSITGFENTELIAALDINLNYNVVDSAVTSATCLNMLFLANVHKPDIPYKELFDLSLRFRPSLVEEPYPVNITETYGIDTNDIGYLDPKFIYNKTGYWGKEIYRFGVVYILNNGELSPVFNTIGGNLSEGQVIKDYNVFDNSGERNYLQYNEETYLTIRDNAVSYENVKGVIRFIPSKDTDTIYGVKFNISREALTELRKYARGFFFVRLKRIPTILALGITIGIDKEAHTPTIPTADGFLNDLSISLEKTHVTTEDINDVNYISEGFLNRYTFKFEKKSSSLFGKILKSAAIVAGVVALATVTAVSGGAIGGIAGAVLSATGSVVTSVGTALGVGGITAAVVGTAVVSAAAGAITALTLATAGAILEARYGIASIYAKKKLDGRNTKAPDGYKIVETDESRQLGLDFKNRIIIKDPSSNYVAGIICPDYEVNLPYFNLIFTGNVHHIEYTKSLGINSLSGHSSNYFTNNDRHFYIPSYIDNNILPSCNLKLVAVGDNVKCVGIDNQLFRSRAGEAEEAWRYECIAEDYKSESTKSNGIEDKETRSNKEINTDIVRGCYGPYLAVGDTSNLLSPATTVNIYIPEYSETNMPEYFYARMVDSSPFYAVSDRLDISDIIPESALVGETINDIEPITVYRGDCYLCLFTHRVNRNFNDPSAPYNDEIVDIDTWKNNYDPENSEKFQEINSGDVNAVQLGMWITFKVRSSYNLNIRTLDESNVDERVMCGHARGYYPYLPMSTEGAYKIPDSQFYNKGFTKSVSERWNFEVPDVPHIKNWFKTRIMYSDIHVNDAFKNGYRVFQGSHYRDYTREYGEIVKLVPFESSLLCVFEHGIALIPVNERAVAGESNGGLVYINTSNVLPENPRIISDMFGSQWPESVLKVPGKSGDAPLYVYGVDTVAKKIWRTDGQSITCISDFKVQEFLNNNISLGERELTPIIGIRNVKTVYNAYKRDVLFTFYDNTYGFEEKVWNLCWNELLQKFITFYSWVPSYMENINNTPFSFDRNTSKWIAKLGTSHTESSFADGITLTNVVVNDLEDDNAEIVNNFNFKIPYITKDGLTLYITGKVTGDARKKFIGVLSLSNRVLPDNLTYYNISYDLVRDQYLNYKKFEIFKVNNFEIDNGSITHNSDGSSIMLPDNAKFAGKLYEIYGLRFKVNVDDDYTEVFYIDNSEFYRANDGTNLIYTYDTKYNPDSIISELYYRNSQHNSYADNDHNKLDTTALPTFEYTPIDVIPNDPSGFTGWQACWIENEARLDLLLACYGDTNVLIGNARPSNENAWEPSYMPYHCTDLKTIRSLIVYSNGQPTVHGIPLNYHWLISKETKTGGSKKVWLGYPIFKDKTGKRVMLPRDKLINPDKIVTLLNIRANISININDSNLELLSYYYNKLALYELGTSLVSAGYYESTIGITPNWNLQFLSSDFWKHGQASIIDIADDIYPTYWYGKQHPFEFEFIVVNDPSIHKIFTNLEIVANKAKPESFHYEIIGEAYDFAKDKVNMYFRLEAIKALWLYNGADIVYDRNFLKTIPRQLPKSADLPHRYYTRLDTINEIEDYYISCTYPVGYDYRHLSGGEIVYYPNRQEYRIWNHAKAVDIDDLSLDDSRSIIASNCLYLEDRWKVTINPILICYKNEYTRKISGALCLPANSTWTDSSRPPLPVYNSPIPDLVYSTIQGNDDNVEIPNVLTNLGYSIKDIDTNSWLNDINIYKYDYGSALNRKEIDIRDKFVKIRIRYSGEELAIIDFINTIYRISYS